MRRDEAGWLLHDDTWELVLDDELPAFLNQIDRAVQVGDTLGRLRHILAGEHDVCRRHVYPGVQLGPLLVAVSAHGSARRTQGTHQ